MPSLAIYAALVATFLITAGDVFFVYESLRDRDIHGLLLPAVALPVFTLSLLSSVRLLHLKRASERENEIAATRLDEGNR